jgi:hypothetical protein
MDAVVLIGTFALVCWVVSASLGWLFGEGPPVPLRGLLQWWDRRRPPNTTASDPAQAILLELELRRIADCLQYEYVSNRPAKAERIRSWTLAYDRVLIELCESCSVPPPRNIPPLSATERFTVEHTLVGSGRSW